MRFRVWAHDEFENCDSAEERDELAWEVPPRRGILNPENFAECNDVDDAAEQFAEHFHSHRDGWECSWPVEFVVHDGVKFHLVEVEREAIPSFSAVILREVKVA